MRLFSSKDYNYVSFEDGYHTLESHAKDCVVKVKEGKFRDEISNLTYICLSDGTKELTYQTQRRLSLD